MSPYKLSRVSLKLHLPRAGYGLRRWWWTTLSPFHFWLWTSVSCHSSSFTPPIFCHDVSTVTMLYMYISHRWSMYKHVWFSKPHITQECDNHICIYTKSLQNISLHASLWFEGSLSYPVPLISTNVSQSCRVPELKQRKYAYLVCGGHQRLCARATRKKTVISRNGLCDMHF